MEFRPLDLAGAWEIRPTPKRDERGYFIRTYDATLFKERGLQTEWVQENQSFSALKGTVRGLHFQYPPYAETKLVRVVQGEVMDVLVDLRTDSPTYGAWTHLQLSADNFSMAYIPTGFAHGFCTRTDNCLITYKVDAPYTPHAEGGLLWNDKHIGITWPVTEPILSERDQRLETFSSFRSPF